MCFSCSADPGKSDEFIGEKHGKRKAILSIEERLRAERADMQVWMVVSGC